MSARASLLRYKHQSYRR